MTSSRTSLARIKNQKSIHQCRHKMDQSLRLLAPPPHEYPRQWDLTKSVNQATCKRNMYMYIHVHVHVPGTFLLFVPGDTQTSPGPKMYTCFLEC